MAKRKPGRPKKPGGAREPVTVRYEPETLRLLDELAAELDRSTFGALGIRGRREAARLAIRAGLRCWQLSGLDGVVREAASVALDVAVRKGREAETPDELKAAATELRAAADQVVQGYPERRAEDRPGEAAWVRSGDTNRSPAHLVMRETAGGLLVFACGQEADPRRFRVAPEDAKRCPKCWEGLKAYAPVEAAE